MEKKLIIERLLATAEKLAALDETKFNYGSYVSKGEIIDGNICNTVCCAAGWYPSWFPESELEWREVGGDIWEDDAISLFSKDCLENKPEDNSVTEKLCEWHGLSQHIIDYLFYGTRLNRNTDNDERIMEILSVNGISICFHENRYQPIYFTDGKFMDGLRPATLSRAFIAIAQMVEEDIIK